MTGKVPIVPPRIVAPHGSKSSLRIAAPIYGDGQHYDMARAVNSMLGVGRQLVSATPMEDAAGDFAIAPGAGGRTQTFWIHPNAAAKSYCWLLTLKLAGSRSLSGWTPGDPTVYPSAYGEFQTVGSVKLGEWSLGGPTGQIGNFRILHHAAGSPTDDQWSLKIINYTGSPNSVFLAGCSLIELPRGEISTIADAETCRTGMPIFEATDHLSSLDGIVRTLPQAQETTRRASMIDFWAPTPINITSGSFQTVSLWVIRPRCLFGNVNRTLHWTAYCRATGGNGELQIATGEDGGDGTDTQTATVTNSAYDYVSGTVGARTEDPSNLGNGGLRDDILEVIALAARKTTGTSIDVQSFKVWESD